MNEAEYVVPGVLDRRFFFETFRPSRLFGVCLCLAMTVRLSLVVLLLTALASTLSTVRGQQSTPSSAIANPSSLSRISSSVTLSLSPNATRAFGGFASVASALATASNSAPVSTSATAAPANSSSPVKPSQRPTLDTRIDATFGILGGLLIVSGLALGSVGTLHRR